MLTNAAIFLPRRLSSKPTTVPTIRVAGTTTAASSSVFRSDSQNSASLKVLVKFARPTHCVGATPVICIRL